MPFIVQSDEKLPVVLVVTDQPELKLVEWLRSFFEAQNLQFLAIQPQEYASTIAQIEQQELWHYKTIVVTGFFPSLSKLFTAFEQTFEQPQLLETKKSEWLTLLNQFSTSAVKPTFIVGQQSLEMPPSNQPLLNFLATLQQQTQDLLENSNKLIPETQIFIGLDCMYQSVEELRNRGEVEFPLLFSLLSLENRLLLDPQQSWYFQSLEDFFLAIGQQLLKPHQSNLVLVRGPEISSQATLAAVANLIETYFAYKPTLLPCLLPEPARVLNPDIVCQTQTTILPAVELQVRTLPHALLKLEELTQRMERFKVTLRFEPHYLLGEIGIQPLIPTEQLPQKNKVSQLQKNLHQSNQSTLVTHPTNFGLQPLLNTVKTDLKPKVGQLAITPSVTTTPNEAKILLNQSKIDLEPMNLEAEIQNLFGQNRQSNRSTRLKDKAKVTQKIVSKSKRHKTVFYFGATLSLIGGVVLCLWFVFTLSLQLTNQAWQQNLVANQENQVIKPPLITRFLDWQLAIYQHILREDLLLEAKTIASLADSSHAYVAGATTLEKSTSELVQQIVVGQGDEFESQVVKQTNTLNEQTKVLENLVEQTKRIDSTELSGTDKSKVMDKITSLSDELKQLQAGKLVLGILPDILGAKTKQSWIVLVQDQQELRPTGGFIQAVGRLNFSQGMLTDTIFQSTYELDSKLSTKVTPPEEIKRFLGEGSWYLRDSNWSPDFPTSAKQSRFFMQEITGQEVNGIIGLTLEGVKRLLAVTGPIDLPELNEQVSDRNLYDRLEFHAETKSIVLNGKNYDYVSLIMTKLMTKITQLPPGKLSELVLVLGQVTTSRDMQVVSVDSSAAEIWKQLGWDGAVVRPACPSQLGTSHCLVDQLYQVDANIGINKVNPYVDKKVMDFVEVGESSVSHRRTITYRNQAKLESWPQGSYRSYVKFLLGKNAVVQSLTIDGQQVPSDQVLSYLEQDDQIIAAPILVPRQKTVTVELRYRLNHTYKAPFAYFFFNQKQPGTTETQDILLSYQPTLKPRLITPQADLTSQLLNFHFVRETQSFVGATFENTRK